ncbi:MAG: malate synthase A [Zoogloeaceae bacterium]|jgi:malate synthase|nr:malate synthase A [Zoogloeaceae bacterium]
MSSVFKPCAALRFTETPGATETGLFTPEAQTLLAELVEAFQPRRDALLARRSESQQKMDLGSLPDFLPETSAIRAADWKIRGIPADLQDRRVEITGPASDRKMVINALNAKVKVFMADFEDALSPTWENVIVGQKNLCDAVRGYIDYTSAEGKDYRLNPDHAVLICRVRGLHLPEKHVLWQNQPLAGALFDFALYFHHNYRVLLDKGSGPYFYLPKLESWHEAAWWHDVFCFTEDRYGLARGTIKATVLIETLPAVFQMHEILHALKDHIVALNCGRWDYIFSYIKTLKNHADRSLPDRQSVTMDQPFLDAYSRLLIKTCHRRGALAMGGMAAFIPTHDADRNAEVFAKVRADKAREAGNGHDGTWIAHPGLAEIALEVFDAVLAGRPNQLHVLREADAPISAAQLLEPCAGARTEAGLRTNLRVALQYLEAWLSGNGCVPIYNLMEDAATAEICRASIWQWLRHGKTLDKGQPVTRELFEACLQEETNAVRREVGDARFTAGRFLEAAELLAQLVVAEAPANFLTQPGYDRLN